MSTPGRSTALAGLLLLAVLAALLGGGCESPRDSSVLRWCADDEGGGPFIYADDDDPERLVGFEVDLAEALAAELDMAPRLKTFTWDNILPLLDRGDVDIALNGFEYTDVRAEQYRASIPYYIYELGLAVRRDDAQTQTWEDLTRALPDGGRKRVGVLKGSSADRYVTEQYGQFVDVKRYDGTTEAFRLLESGQLDGTVQDWPALAFYLTRLERFPSLRLVEQAADPGYYVIYARRDDAALIARLNDAIRQLYESGRLREIYESYGIWNATQERLPEVWEQGLASGVRERSSDVMEVIRRQIPLLLRASGVTVALAVLSMPLAMLIGLFCALVRAWDSPVLGGSGQSSWLSRLLRFPVTLYVEVVRGTPLAFQLFVVFFLLPELGVRISEFQAGVIALAINYSAYEAEIFRLGLNAIPRGQIEAALALGMPRALAVRRIILPQAVRLVIPATANDFIALFKDTAVCSVIAVEELSRQYSMSAKNTNLFLEMALAASILYLLMSYPLSLAAGWLERRLKPEARV